MTEILLHYLHNAHHTNTKALHYHRDWIQFKYDNEIYQYSIGAN